MSDTKKPEKVVAVRKGDAAEKTMKLHQPETAKPQSATVAAIRKTCAWVVIISLILFAVIAIVSIWTDLGHVMGRAWSTLLVVGFVAGFIALVAPLIDQK